MIIDCVSDLHGYYPKLEGGDLLIVAGDLTARDAKEDYIELMAWHDLISFKYKKSIFIGGNHDNLLQKYGMEFAPSFCEYLCDSGTEFEYEEDDVEQEECGMHPTVTKKLKIWGSPWTKRFKGMNPHCMAFTVDTEEELAEKFSNIPNDIDILITHSPPLYILDELMEEGKHAGSIALSNRIRGSRTLKLHVFGHIHEGYGEDKNGITRFVNASHVNSVFDPVNKPIRIEL